MIQSFICSAQESNIWSCRNPLAETATTAPRFRRNLVPACLQKSAIFAPRLGICPIYRMTMPDFRVKPALAVLPRFFMGATIPLNDSWRYVLHSEMHWDFNITSSGAKIFGSLFRLYAMSALFNTVDVTSRSNILYDVLKRTLFRYSCYWSLSLLSCAAVIHMIHLFRIIFLKLSKKGKLHAIGSYPSFPCH